jgi:hypothetical protein
MFTLNYQMLDWCLLKLILELADFFMRHYHRLSFLVFIISTSLFCLCHLSFHEILIQFVNINVFIIFRRAAFRYYVLEAVPLQPFNLYTFSQILRSLVADLG